MDGQKLDGQSMDGQSSMDGSAVSTLIKELESQVTKLKAVEQQQDGGGDRLDTQALSRFEARENDLQRQLAGTTQRAEMAEQLAEANSFSVGIVERRRLEADHQIAKQHDEILHLRGALLMCIEDPGTPEQRRIRFQNYV